MIFIGENDMKEMTKKAVLVLMIFSILFASVVYATGTTKTIKALINSFSISVNGNKIASNSIYYNGIVYVPANTVGKALGVKTLIDTKNNLVSFGEGAITKTINKSGKISKAAFDKLKTGMSYDEATAIIGYDGELVSESGNKGDDLYTVMYIYYGSGMLGANANLMFQGDKLMNKAQMGLK